MDRSYLIRHGQDRQVGRFAAGALALARGQTVVIRSQRGTELGEVLAELPPPAAPVVIAPASARVLRLAGADDLGRARQAESLRDEQYELCRQIFADGVWPIELIDVEPLLDGRTVLQYLGPRVDQTALRALLRERHGLDVVLEPVGLDIPDPDEAGPHDHEQEHEHAGCGSGGCGSGSGGCATGGCGSSAGGESGGCSGCSVKALIGSRRVSASGAE